MRFLNCLCGLLTTNIIEKINHYPIILNTRFTPPLFSHNENDRFNYGSEERRRFKDLSKIRYLVQDHHCIPRQFRNHKLVREIDFDVNCSRNILIKPTKFAKYLRALKKSKFSISIMNEKISPCFSHPKQW